MSTVLTIRCPIIKGKLTLESNPMNPSEYMVTGTNYVPMTYTANTLGDAVNTLMLRLSSLTLSPEAQARRKARGKKMAESHANRIAEASRNGKRNRKPETKPADLESVVTQ